jgi:hypothetical protein
MGRNPWKSVFDHVSAEELKQFAEHIKRGYQRLPQDSSADALEDQWGTDSQDSRRGRKVLEGAKLGGRQDPDRDRRMAQEFLRRQPQSKMSATALKVDIGAKHDLRRRAAIDAVDRGLKKIVR